MRTALFATLLAAAVAGCATTGSSDSGRPSSGGPDRISSEELREMDAENLDALEAINRLRATWLRSRGSSFGGGRTQPMVFVDGIEYGGASSLRDINTTDIEEIRYLDARDATTRFGTGYAGGAILVTIR